MAGVEFAVNKKIQGFPDYALVKITEDGNDEYWIVRRVKGTENMFLLRKAVLVTEQLRLMYVRLLLIIQVGIMLWLCSGIIKAVGLLPPYLPELSDGVGEGVSPRLRTICSVMVVIGAESFMSCFFLVAWEMLQGCRPHHA